MDFIGYLLMFGGIAVLAVVLCYYGWKPNQVDPDLQKEVDERI